MARCVICNNKIGFFSKSFTVNTGDKICDTCFQSSDPIVLMENISSAKDVAFYMDNPIGDKYLAKIGEKSLSDSRKEQEKERKKQEDIWEKQHQEELEHAQRRQEALKTLEAAKEKSSRQEIFHFKVRGITHHNLSKMVTYARKNELFEPYDGWTVADIKEMAPYEEIFEVNLSGLISTITFIPEPENKYDSNAIQVHATLDENDYMIGYVPADYTSDISNIIKDQQANTIDLRIEYELTGGKYKIADDDDNDFSDNPKLKITTGKYEYGFNIQLFDNNID